ncbi:MAG: hypothetical protein ACRBK7_05665 [Acidimicrobiales bacterium]
MGSIRRDKLPTALIFALGFVVLLVMAILDGTLFSYFFLALFAALAWWSWPGRVGRHAPHAEAQAAAADDDVIVYWRPG